MISSLGYSFLGYFETQHPVVVIEKISITFSKVKIQIQQLKIIHSICTG